MNSYLCETEYIDFTHPLIAEKVKELRGKSNNSLDYINQTYLFVRDEITHTWDAKETIVSKKASDVLRNKTGICWTKSCLLAALLRANGIPAGISYQNLTRADEDDSEGYIIHALNTVYISELNKWIRLDARGNKENVQAEFSIDQERLAFIVRPEFGEIDYKDNHPDLDKRLCMILEESNNILQIHTDFDM
ncbi:MAG: transglutaminase domain-containing protein [Lachnospiraceae bacterium]|nr:transglutaminase domain-containing protein [Lachnospiraceae bacterium]MBP3505600.1 transglutaminase domain-containing protein [Lachnospiraceae bacterium]